MWRVSDYSRTECMRFVYYWKLQPLHHTTGVILYRTFSSKVCLDIMKMLVHDLSIDIRLFIINIFMYLVTL